MWIALWENTALTTRQRSCVQVCPLTSCWCRCAGRNSAVAANTSWLAALTAARKPHLRLTWSRRCFQSRSTKGTWSLGWLHCSSSKCDLRWRASPHTYRGAPWAQAGISRADRRTSPHTSHRLAHHRNSLGWRGRTSRRLRWCAGTNSTINFA